MTTTHTTVTQNKAHRADQIWIKVGLSEYMRADGVTIRKHNRIRGYWEILLPNGETPQQPNSSAPTGFLNRCPAVGQSLSYAKLVAEDVTPNSPLYVFI